MGASLAIAHRSEYCGRTRIYTELRNFNEVKKRVPEIEGKTDYGYLPAGTTVIIQMGKISGTHVKGWWFNPRTAEATVIGEFANKGIREFEPPGEEEPGNDWILVLDDSTRGYGVPGRQSLF